jgi:4-hydroxythreonine-4-phosphate dehydrogenase
MNSLPKPIAITSGDPNGIGPEIVLKSCCNTTFPLPVIIIGENKYFPNHPFSIIHHINEAAVPGCYFLNINSAELNTDPSFAYVRYAVAEASKGNLSAIVTAPISKHHWHLAQIPYAGHTDFLAQQAKVKEYAMCFWSDNLRVILFTIHQPLKTIFRKIKKTKIVSFLRFCQSALQLNFNQSFHFLIPGINPHAGENGILGSEEEQEIIPALNQLKGEIDFSGPYPPDVIFRKALTTKNSVVISWYHDQGLIPFKLLHFNTGVNLTLGLPFIRTSPDHGTAFDIAGKNTADPSSMRQAIELAVKLVNTRYSYTTK